MICKKEYYIFFTIQLYSFEWSSNFSDMKFLVYIY